VILSAIQNIDETGQQGILPAELRKMSKKICFSASKSQLAATSRQKAYMLHLVNAIKKRHSHHSFEQIKSTI